MRSRRLAARNRSGGTGPAGRGVVLVACLLVLGALFAAPAALASSETAAAPTNMAASSPGAIPLARFPAWSLLCRIEGPPGAAAPDEDGLRRRLAEFVSLELCNEVPARPLVAGAALAALLLVHLVVAP